MDAIKPGLMAEVRATVTEEMTAVYMRSGSVQVYATPSMIALMEEAAVEAIDGLLMEGTASVGIHVDVEHVSATGIGEEVRAQAEVVDVDGKRVTFNVRAWDEHDLIGEGTHIRYVIDVERFMQRLEDKGSQE